MFSLVQGEHGLPLLNETRSTCWTPEISVRKSRQASSSCSVCNHLLSPIRALINCIMCKNEVSLTLETVRSVISCSKARVSSACFWLCSAIFSLNFLGFEPPVPGEPDMVRAAVFLTKLQLLFFFFKEEWKGVAGSCFNLQSVSVKAIELIQSMS